MLGISDATENLVPSMREFGLTEYETKIYLTLSNRQIASASELSRVSGVPYTKVYSVLSSLTGKGLVEIMRGKPAVYRIINPERALRTLKESKIVGVSRAYEEVVSSLRKIRSNESRPNDDEHGASWNISGKRNVINKLREELDGAVRSVKIVFPNLDILGKPILNQIFTHKHERHIKLLVSQRDEKFLKGISNVDAKYADTIKSRYALFDDRYCLMMAVETPDYWTGVFETCGNCTRQAREHFELAWKAAEEI